MAFHLLFSFFFFFFFVIFSEPLVMSSRWGGNWGIEEMGKWGNGEQVEITVFAMDLL